jgi:hypothetical protein
MSAVALVIGREWGGRVVAREERAELRVSWEPEHLRIDVNAPYVGDPAPVGAVGPTDGLWEHEVVELFAVFADGSYVELELSPHGHHLLLTLSGVRQVTARGLPVEWAPSIDHTAGRYTGTARIPRTLFPSHPKWGNAFRIAGVGEARRYFLMGSLPGDRPDFHQVTAFPPWLV